MTTINGAQWRLFYTELWPTDWYIDDVGVAFENEDGTYVLPDSFQANMDTFGLMGYQGRDIRQPKGLVPISDVWYKIMEARTKDPLTPEFLRS